MVSAPPASDLFWKLIAIAALCLSTIAIVRSGPPPSTQRLEQATVAPPFTEPVTPAATREPTFEEELARLHPARDPAAAMCGAGSGDGCGSGCCCGGGPGRCGGTVRGAATAGSGSGSGSGAGVGGPPSRAGSGACRPGMSCSPPGGSRP